MILNVSKPRVMTYYTINKKGWNKMVVKLLSLNSGEHVAQCL